jgi:hypothetical protein
MSEQFEEAVELTLAHMARVDASTVLDTRAAIAALPDRRWTRAVRVRRSVSGLSLPRWPRAVALAGAAVVVAVVAVSMFGALQPRPVGPNSPAPSMATPSTSSSASPGVMPTPSAIRTGPAYSETLPVLLTGNHVWFAGWSPDGSRYAIGADGLDSGGLDSGVIHLFDRSGTEIGSVAGREFQFAWLDANRFVVIAMEDQVNNSGPLDAFMGRVGSTQLTKLGEYDTLVAGPSGSVALAQIGDPSVSTKHQYVVVSADGSVSKPRDGKPAAWSRDGSMLAVYHATGLAPALSDATPPDLGYLEVVRSTGESVASTHGLTFGEPYPVFSPDGARVAFPYDPKPLTGAAQMAVLEIASGHLAVIPESGGLTWASNDQLLFAYKSIDYGKTPSAIMSWSAATGLVTTYGPGDTVCASGQGTVVIGSDTTDFTWTSTTGGSTRSGAFSLGYGLGFGSYILDSAWSPDGSSLILTVGDWNNGTAMDAVLFRP